MMILKDKVVIVSGIGPGLGQALSTHAAIEGAAVVMAARTPGKLDAAAAEIAERAPGARLLKHPTDITSRDQCADLVKATVDTFGRVDVLINSAYIGGKMEPIESADLDDWHATMETNLFGTMNLTQAVIPQMKSQGGGSIVMVNTMVVRRAMLFNAGYATSKGALKSATAHLALELGQYGIRVNSTFMGWMWGPNVEGYVKSAAQERGISEDVVKREISQNIALRCIPDDADCAKAVVMLASDYASVVTGACLDVNGGDFIP